MGIRRALSLGWLLVVVAVGIWAIPAQAEDSRLGPWEQSLSRNGINPVWGTAEGTAYGLEGHALYRTDDDGMTFTSLKVGDRIHGVAVVPSDRTRVYAGDDSAAYRGRM